LIFLIIVHARAHTSVRNFEVEKGNSFGFGEICGGVDARFNVFALYRGLAPSRASCSTLVTRTRPHSRRSS